MDSVRTDEDGRLLNGLRDLVSSSTTGYTTGEFLRCVITPRDEEHLGFWLQCEGSENLNKLFTNERPGEVILEDEEVFASTALYLACDVGWKVGVQKLLLAGADPNMGKYKMTKGSDPLHKETPLMAALKNDRGNIVTALLDHGAQVNYTVSSSGMKTALEVALVNDTNPYYVLKLLQNGARPRPRQPAHQSQAALINVILSAVSAYGLYCCEYCRFEQDHGGKCTCVEHMARYHKTWVQVVELMISAGFDVNEEECLAASSPLYWSVQYRDCKLLQILIQAGADVDYCSPRFGNTVLQHAVSKGNADAVRILIQNGANTNAAISPRRDNRYHGVDTNSGTMATNPNWMTSPLGVAIKEEKYRIARYLADAGTVWCHFSRVQLVLFMKEKCEKLRRKGQEVNDLEYLCSLAFQPRSLLQLSRAAIRRTAPCLKPDKIKTLTIPTELHGYLLCDEMV